MHIKAGRSQTIPALITVEASHPTSPAAFLCQSQPNTVALKPQCQHSQYLEQINSVPNLQFQYISFD